MSYTTFGIGDYLSGTFSSTYSQPLTIVVWVHRTAAQWDDTTTDWVAHFGNDFVDRFNAIGIACGSAADRVISAQSNATSQDLANLDFTAGAYDDRWVPIVGVYVSSTDRTIYIGDSSNKLQDTNGYDPGADLDSLIIGSRLDDTQQFAGNIAEVAIFDSEWTDAMVDQLMIAQSASVQAGITSYTVDPDNCIGYWSLNSDQTSHADEGPNGTGPSLAESGTVAYAADHPTIIAAGYPRIADWAVGHNDSANKPQSIALTGVTVTAGQLLMVIASVDGLDITLDWDQTTAGTWTALWSDVNGNTINGNCYYKVADGTEDTKTLSVSPSTAEAMSWMILVIDDWGGSLASVEATTATGASSQPNPPSETASWGAEKNLWIAGYHHDDAVDGAVSTWSEDYHQYETQSTSNGNTTVAVSTAFSEIATYDPGNYNSTGSDQWISFTIVIRPVVAATGEVFNRVLTENTVVTDPVPGYILSQERPANSNIELLTDAAFLYYAFARLVAEYLPLTDQYIMEQSVRRDLSESATLTDAIEILHQYFRNLSNAIEVSDDLTKSITVGEVGTTYSKVRKDVLRVTDNLDAVFLGIYNRNVSDTIALGEAAFLARFKHRPLVDQIAIISDLMNLTRTKVLRDTFKTIDALSIKRIRINSVTTLDAFNLVDSFERDLQYIKRKRLTDVMELYDSEWFETGTTLKPPVPIEHGIQER